MNATLRDAWNEFWGKKPEPAKSYKLLTIDINPDLYADLKERASSRDISATELLRRAVTLDFAIEDYLEDGWEIIIDRDGTYRKVEFI